uniref:hypothetical protein n=1 Tax=Paractinoplanes polyasparticus TaxID=2856853 RepID=UPI001C85B90E|nr:hypothetical protein [Actinoplanes polyasparticus]
MTTSNQQAALLLERAMLDPRFAAVCERARETAPVGFRDQADAAISEATDLLQQAGQLISDEASRLVTPGELPGWLRLGIIQAFVSWISGGGETCRHNLHPGHPQPIFAALWRPDLTVCGFCLHLFSLAPDSEAAHTCDACGRVCARTADDGITPGMLQIGPLTVQYGACDDCLPATLGRPC